MEEPVIEFFKGVDAIEEKHKDRLNGKLDNCFKLGPLGLEFVNSDPLDTDIRNEIIYLYSKFLKN